MRATPLGPERAGELARLLEERPLEHLALIALLAQHGADARWLGALDDRGRLVAAAWADPPPRPGRPAFAATPAGDPAGCRAIGALLAARGGTTLVTGPREAADALWEGLGRRPNRVRHDQRLYACAEPSPGPALAPRVPLPEEVPEVARLSARMVAEELSMPWAQVDLDAVTRRTRELVAERRVLVVALGGRIAFCVRLGPRSRHGVVASGVYVPPDLRGRGIATRAVRGLCRELLREVPRVVLHVNEDNTPAIRAYERAGFRRGPPFRLVSV